MSSYNLSSFNSKGKISQIEYASKAVLQSNTVISVKGNNLLLTLTLDISNKKNIFTQIEPKVFIINKYIILSASGLKSDIIIVISKARSICRDFQHKYGHQISTASLSKDLSSFLQNFTSSSGFRPLGVSLNILGIDKDGPELFEINTSGEINDVNFSSIGKSSKDIKEYIRARWCSNLETKTLLKLVINCLNYYNLVTSKLVEIVIATINTQPKIKIFSKEDLSILNNTQISN
ncbi:similar to proteasome A-type submit (nucleomorph) [Guillardia theta]|uniref:Similar to proteasome A-type submit n=1 Tax=Guillardia theta TaxID=55529 RepID=Q98RW3_GUITH|nr:similar to proteasome A-type submit [Guillardia theta]AAK39837.1 similar to proteasome A-type submit [Guillardia theta]|mmetsp:Transcript_37597/g.118703  ORF Transcript_37597/g.118703 Transcript_37597/m.118703 type:complete len:234 (-) Transcript_37597:1782-2483(-)